MFIAGDFNVGLDNNSDVYSSNINDFLLRHSLSRCDDLFPQAKVATYANATLNHQSQIDYAVTFSSMDVVNFEVLDPDLNFSDHLHLLATVVIMVALCNRADHYIFILFMVALCNRTDHYIFILFLLLLSSFFLLFFPRLISAVGDWMFTILWHMVWP